MSQQIAEIAAYVHDALEDRSRTLAEILRTAVERWDVSDYALQEAFSAVAELKWQQAIESHAKSDQLRLLAHVVDQINNRALRHETADHVAALVCAKRRDAYDTARDMAEVLLDRRAQDPGR